MSSAKKTKVVICGATGFIGHNLFDSMVNRPDYEIVGVYHDNIRPRYEHPRLTWVQADLRRAEDVERVVKGADILIQAAATTTGAADVVHRPYVLVTDNAVMNSLIFRAAHEHSVKHVIFFSCTVMYASGLEKAKETDFDDERIEPAYFGVGWMKVYCERLAEFYSRLGRTRFTVLRHSNIYGPYDKYNLERSHFFSATIVKVMTAKDGKIVIWGTGEAERDLLHVDDMVNYVQTALDKQTTPFDLSNVALGKSYSVNDVVSMINKISGRNLTIEHDKSKPNIPTKLGLDISKAKATFGWTPKISLEDGIKRTIEWYKKNFPQ